MPRCARGAASARPSAETRSVRKRGATAMSLEEREGSARANAPTWDCASRHAKVSFGAPILPSVSSIAAHARTEPTPCSTIFRASWCAA